MRRAWKRVAERGDNPAYALEEIADVVAPALEGDWNAEVRPQFLRGVRAVFEQRDARLFNDDLVSRIEAFRNQAGCGLETALLNNVTLVADEEADGILALFEATKAALNDRAARRARQMEEHYLRRSSAPRAAALRRRLQQGTVATDLEAVAVRVLKLDANRARSSSLRRRGLDDGVRLR